MSDCLAIEELAAFVDGATSDTVRLDSHLASCGACRRAVLLLASAREREPEAQSVDAARRQREAPLRPGAKLGRYTVLEAVGAGSSGVVYAAYDASLDRKVALKVLRQPERIATDRGRRLLVREARALARVSDPHVVHVFDVGTIDGREVVAMEFVEGRTLRAWIESEAPSPTMIIEVMLQAARGLSAAHAAGLVHRDFKPDNVLVSKSGASLRVKVADFGLAHGLFSSWRAWSESGVSGDGDSDSDSDSDSDGDSDNDSDSDSDGGRGRRRVALSTIGACGGFVGTPAYMAPEQARGDEIDARADQFAFAVVLYEALAGARPYSARELSPLLAQMADPAFVIPTAGLPVAARARRAILRALRPSAEERFASLDELAKELAPRSRFSSSWTGRLAALGALAVLALASWSGMRASHPDPCKTVASHGRDHFSTEQRRAMREAFLATKLPYAEEAWARVEARVSQHLDAWETARVQQCFDATTPSPLSDLRESCLQSNLLYTNAFLETLATANTEVVEGAVAAAYELPPVSSCDDFEALVNRGAPAPASDRRARYDELEAALARASAASRAGHYADANDEAGRIAGEAEALGDKPLHAQSLLLWGATAEHLGRFEDARDRYERSALVALAGNDDLGALAAGARLVPVLAYRFSEAAEANQWIDQSSALAERLGERAHPHDAILLEGRGIAAYQRGAFAEAKDHYEEALKRLRRRGAGADPEVASILLRSAHAERYLGQVELAESTLLEALRLRIELFGEDHPLVADVRTELGALYEFNGRIEEAHEALDRALASQLRAFGENHIEVAYTVNRLGNLELAAGQWDDALEKFRRVLRIGEASLGAHNTEVGMAHHNIAECLSRMGKLDDAEVEEHIAERTVESTVGQKHPYFAMITNGLAVIERLKGKPENAEALHAAALVIVQARSSENPGDVADLQIELGRDALAAGQAVDALAHFDAASKLRARERMHPLDAVSLDLDWAEAASKQHDTTLASGKIASARATLASLPHASTFPRAQSLLARADELEGRKKRGR